MKKLLCLVLVLTLCLSAASAFAGSKIGVAMPTNSIQRWNQDGANMKAQLEAAGYEVDLQFANNEVTTQISQLETMILNGAQVLVIASIDGGALDTVLATAAENDIPVIAYDRLLTGTTHVDYYTTFDNYGVGAMQGNYIKEKLDLDNAVGPFTIEFFAGSPDDNNALIFYQGTMDVLKPYIDAGKLVVPSGQIEFAQVATPSWKTETAQARMDNILVANYSDGTKLDACLCSSDQLSLGVTNSLVNFGFTAEDMPLITAQDCDIVNTRNLINGLLSMEVFKDTRVLAAQTVQMINDLMSGKEPEVNASYDNGVITVPSYNCTPVFVDINNYQEVLVDSGYYTADQLSE